MLHIIGMKWTIPVLEAMKRPHRKFQFNAMLSMVSGITPKNLSRILRELSDAGLVKRAEIKEKGVLHTEYHLTEKGIALNEFIRESKILGVSLYHLESSCVNKECGNCELARA